MKLVECFESIQGEGKTQGRRCLFIRFAGCNLSCSFCDSKYTWNGIEKVKEFTNIEELINKNNNIVFTGGEPFLKPNLKQIISIADKYSEKNYEIETNGTILLPEDSFFDNASILFNISPKVNVEQEEECNIEPIFISQVKYLAKQNSNIDYIVKFLFKDKEDLDHIKKMQQKYYIESSKIWCQPCGVDSETLKNTITNHFDEIINNGWNVSMRLHIFLFGNRRAI